MKPILFNTEMVRAIQDGRKTVTRRVMKPQPLFKTTRRFVFADDMCPKKWEDCDNFLATYQYQPGDILYVRETFATSRFESCLHRSSFEYGMWYKADGEKDGYKYDWSPSIHMPKEAARIFLRVTDVQVERLKDINRDVFYEGFDSWNDFVRLWNSTIKTADRDRYGWNANPWVWVIRFERISKEEVKA